MKVNTQNTSPRPLQAGDIQGSQTAVHLPIVWVKKERIQALRLTVGPLSPLTQRARCAAPGAV